MNKLIYTILIVVCLSLNCKAQSHRQYIGSQGKIDTLALKSVIDDIDSDKVDKKSISSIKMKIVTGITNSAEGGVTQVAHGLDITKIVGFTVIVRAAASVIVPPNYTFYVGYEYNTYIGTSLVDVDNHATNSENILSKSFSVMIWYLG